MNFYYKFIYFNSQKKIEEAINDFNSKLSEIAKIEIDKYTQNPYVGEMDDLPDEE